MKIWLIILLELAVFHGIQSKLRHRLVKNTTCLQLAKPSNQQFRLTCSNPKHYHCLLDETFSQEFEVCAEFKWIDEGKCAYFNSIGGQIDQMNCIQKNNLTCSNGTDVFQSVTNTKYTACYVKKEIGTSLPATTNPTGTHSVNGTSDGRNAISVSTTIDKRDQKAMYDLPAIILGIFVPFISLAVIYLIFRNLKDVPLHKKVLKKNLSGSESQDSSDIVRNEDTVEQQPFLKNEVEDIPGSPPTMRHEDENIIEARRNVISDADDHADLMDKSDLSEHFEDAVSSKTSNIQKNSEVSAEKHQKGDNDEAEVDISENLKEGGSIADVQRKNVDEEKSAENASGVSIVSDKSDNEEGDKQEETDMFDDTVESLQRIAPPTDDQDREVCTELYNLLGTEGMKLIQDVMAAIITRETGKSVKILLNNLTDQEKNKLKVIWPEESHRILESKTEHKTSFHVLYGLHRIFLDEEQCPKYGWGNPVSGKNLGIGDDVERLYRILTIVQRISNPVTMSVENYIRLLDIMIEALTRLDPGAEFKEDYKLLSYKLESIKNPNLTKTMLNKFTDIVKRLW